MNSIEHAPPTNLKPANPRSDLAVTWWCESFLAGLDKLFTFYTLQHRTTLIHSLIFNQRRSWKNFISHTMAYRATKSGLAAKAQGKVRQTYIDRWGSGDLVMYRCVISARYTWMMCCVINWWRRGSKILLIVLSSAGIYWYVPVNVDKDIRNIFLICWVFF